VSAIARVRRRESLHWAVAAAPVGFWMIHLVYMAAVATRAESSTWRWTLYAITPVTAIPTLVCMGLSWHWYRRYSGAETGSEDAQLGFIGLLGVAHGAFNLLLILAEGALVPILSGRG
jgi:hypothetical protein